VIARAEFVQPFHLWIPDTRVGSYGPEAIELCQLAGLTFDPEQELAIDSIMSHDRYGNFCAEEACIVECRQNGKTNRVMIPITLHKLFLAEPDLIMHTAHRFKTSSEAFVEYKRIINGCYEMRRRVKRISDSHGEESIELTNGAKLYVIARNANSGRGLGGGQINLDESFALQDEQMGALMPTTLARPDALTLYASSAGLKHSSVLRIIRDRAYANNDDSLVYIEWKAPGGWEDPGCALGKKCDHHRGIEGCSLDDPEKIKMANPAMARSRMTLRKIRTMRKALSTEEYGREICGWWSIPAEQDDVIPIKIEDWMKSSDPDSKISGSIVLSFDVSIDRKSGSISISGKRSDGVIHSEVVYSGRISKIPSEVLRLKNRYTLHDLLVGDPKANKRVPAIICDASGPASALLPDLQILGIHPYIMTAREVGMACGGLQDAVAAGPTVWVHIGQVEGNIAIEGAAKRNIGDGGWAFGRRKSAESSVDICPITTIAMARWGVTVAAKPRQLPRAKWS
jgi:hypothetical protein